MAELTYESSRIFVFIRTLVSDQGGVKWEFGNGGDRQCIGAFECLVVPEASRVDPLF